MKKFGRIALKTLLWIIASVIFLILLVVILIQVPAVQNFAKNKAVTFLQNKIGTKVAIGHLSLGLPKLIVLEDVYFEDQKRDTLIAGDKLKVDISLFKLLDNTVEINEINLQGITANISRGPDSLFNFDYIMKAFAGEQKKEVKPTDTTSTMKFAIGDIILDRINIKYKDATTGNDIKFLLGHFDTRIKDFDLDKMKFGIPKINLSGINATIIQTPMGSSVAQTAATDTAATEPLNMELDLGEVDISKVKVDYRSGEMAAKVDLGKLLVAMDKIDLKKQQVGIANITLDQTNATVTFAKPQTVAKAAEKAAKTVDTLVSSPAQSAWAVTLKKFTITNNNIKFDNNAQKPLKAGLDPAHMFIKNLNVDIENVSYNPDSSSGRINAVTFNEKSGFALKKFNTDFFYGPKSAYLKDLLVETPNTVLQKSVEVSYPSIDALSKDIGSLGVNANLDGSRLGMKDVTLLMPAMATMPQMRNLSNAVFRINGKIDGKVSDLHIRDLELLGFGTTRIRASADMRGLPDMNKAYFNVNLKEFNTSRADIYKLASAGMIPPTVSIPANINLKGTFKGSMTDFDTKMALRSSYGAVDLTANMRGGKRKGKEKYSANIRAVNLNVGALTKQPQMVGMVSMSANIKGVSLDPKRASLSFNGNVAKAYVKGYNYQNLVMEGSASNGSYVAKAYMKDPNINFNLDATANMNKKYPSVNATLLVDSINMQNLKLTKDPMRFHGKLVADVPTADPDYLNADIMLTDMVLIQKAQRIQLDTVSLKSTATADSSSLWLKTPMLTAHMGGKYTLTGIAPAMQDMIAKYFNAALATGAKPAPKVKYPPQQFKFDMRFVKTPLIEQFAPDLKTLDPVLINGSFNSTSGELLVKGTMPKIVYGEQIVNNMALDINTADSALNYKLSVDEVKVSPSIDILYTTISGNLKNDKLFTSLQVRDHDKKERYRIAGTLSVLPQQYQFSFVQDGLLLDYMPWAVNADNALSFGNKGILAHNFTITNTNQVLSVNSNPQQPNSPIDVQFRNFKIETLTKMAQQDSLQVGGTINGDANISNFQASPVFTAAINVNDFNFKGDTVGNIALKVDNQTANAYAANVSITGKGNQVNLSGLYYTAPDSRMDMTLNIVKLDMKSIQGFSFGAIRNSTGDITGSLKITGTPTAPAVRGDINFNKVGFNVSMLNSYFRMPQESITFNEQGIRFNDFTLVDSTGNKAVVSGSVYTKTYTDFAFGMNINADNFRVINSTQADNKLFWGKLYIDTDVKIRGDMNSPVVDATLTVNEKTDMTFVLPTADPSVEDREGVVEFIDKDAPKLDSILLARQLDSLRKSDVTGMDVSATINVHKNANFNIVVDERSGDMVKDLRGEASLNGGIDPSGKINLTGSYTVNHGSYNLSFATVKRQFLFKSGSTIQWTGDPTSANIDLTAIYVANVPPVDLIASQSDAQTLVMAKQKLPFNVNLNLKNELLKPNISFDIILPDSNYSMPQTVLTTVENKLAQVRQDPNELNKQVLGVLILGHFIGDNPLQSQGGGGGVEGAIRNSVSGLLTDQLNNLAGGLVSGVDLDFGLSSGEDYSSGTATNRTDLNVGVSKRFLSDRLTVSVGNNFNLEGAQAGQKTTNIAGNVSVNYKLSRDGRYTLRAYRKDEFVVIQGQIVETGLGFTLTMDYNRFSEIFHKRTEEEKAMRRKYRQEEKRKKEEEDKRNQALELKDEQQQQQQEQKKEQPTN
ncbi:translocation/assembly module TamB domain-containing protein [Mucilaginibacter sp. JRF]|uniref:translocation/assembly module TamB domain-containing protein n=1 Tax=Mucilaginibacter sp. JRF TaxID=2780088 RepID=UPI00187E083E|nr:translocation/assembly module TamB domain-containing protein [Mucilaginibacter sp. JRF]MBE9584368.1 translocation/assembly module TamB domain-containing protein [Mucilaginibacter sp. JRF]